jgi:hypothetical protein
MSWIVSVLFSGDATEKITPKFLWTSNHLSRGSIVPSSEHASLLHNETCSSYVVPSLVYLDDPIFWLKLSLLDYIITYL